MAPIVPTAKMPKIGATDVKSMLLSNEISFFGSCVSILVFRRCKIPVERNICILQESSVVEVNGTFVSVLSDCPCGSVSVFMIKTGIPPSQKVVETLYQTK